MILANGTVYPSSEQDRLLAELEDWINETRRRETLPPDVVINAIDALARRIEAGEFEDLIAGLGIEEVGQYIDQAVRMLKKENLQYKVETELGRDFFRPAVTQPPFDLPRVQIRPAPLGTLFHIAAGNVDALPAFSVAEGLVTGNVNILKLPQADNGLTVRILQELIGMEPRLKNFIYVFDTPSTDVSAMMKMAAMADGIVVWGGDMAVQAVRKLAAPGAKLIEWGHRLSFAYVSGDYRKKPEELTALAEHIMRTKQLLCSSCQTIFLNTDAMEEIEDFCRVFLPHLEAAEGRYPVTEVGAVAEITLRRYSESLEKAMAGEKTSADHVFRGRRCSLTACEDQELTLSDLYGNCHVKGLPEERVMAVLRRQKGYLQTAGLICGGEERQHLTELLIRCGVNRVTSPGHMSETFSGEAHDGEYSLRRYVRIVNVEV